MSPKMIESFGNFHTVGLSLSPRHQHATAHTLGKLSKLVAPLVCYKSQSLLLHFLLC